MNQPSIFSAENPTASTEIPKAPTFAPYLARHTPWPFPGMTSEDSARAEIARSVAYRDMLAAVIKAQGIGPFTTGQVQSLVPNDWRELCGRFSHGSLDFRDGKERGIGVKHVTHDGGGFHFEYSVIDEHSFSKLF